MRSLIPHVLDGDVLTLQSLDIADCAYPYPVIEAILTTNAWRRAA